MRITLDSTEPLDDAIRVVGALFGVTLRVSDGDRDPIKSAGKKQPSRRSVKPGKARKRPSAMRNNGRSRTAKVADTARSKTDRVAQSNGAPSSAEVRSWARENGLTVNDRGRVPASVMSAYRSAHTK